MIELKIEDLRVFSYANIIHSFIHSGYFYSVSSSPLLQKPSRYSMDTVPEFHAVTPQAIVSEGLAQGPYAAARAGVEPMTRRTKCADSTNAPHTPHNDNSYGFYNCENV